MLLKIEYLTFFRSENQKFEHKDFEELIEKHIKIDELDLEKTIKYLDQIISSENYDAIIKPIELNETAIPNTLTKFLRYFIFEEKTNESN